MSTGREEWSARGHVGRYLDRCGGLGRRADGEAVLEGLVPADAGRVLDLGTGDGHLVALLGARRPTTRFVGLDISPPMLAAAAERFSGDDRVVVLEHDLAEPLSPQGPFDAVISAFAIHHLDDGRKRVLSQEVFGLLAPGGVFANLEHVASPTPALHAAFLEEIGYTSEEEDDSNRCAGVEAQLGWLRGAGFNDVDCLWKWREMALLVGFRPGREGWPDSG